MQTYLRHCFENVDHHKLNIGNNSSVMILEKFMYSKFDCRPTCRPLYRSRPCMCMLYPLVLIYVMYLDYVF